ncbi:hypothetical protein NIES4106_46360 [Fischerella sp. NIES-4106]|jgi:hypothetical protein|nr:hypothetical protein NIES4106_46360 [Fischerella sp. NIES-4106]
MANRVTINWYKPVFFPRIKIMQILNFEQNHLLRDHTAHSATTSIRGIVKQLGAFLTTVIYITLTCAILYKYSST